MSASNLWRQGMTRRGWSLNDTNKKRFVVIASLDTFVFRKLVKLTDHYVTGFDIEEGVRDLFGWVTWFMVQPERKANIQSSHDCMLFLAEVVDYHIVNELLIDNLTIHFDGSVTWV